MRFSCLILLKPEPPQLFAKLIGYIQKWEAHVLFSRHLVGWIMYRLFWVLVKNHICLQIACSFVMITVMLFDVT